LKLSLLWGGGYHSGVWVRCWTARAPPSTSYNMWCSFGTGRPVLRGNGFLSRLPGFRSAWRLAWHTPGREGSEAGRGDRDYFVATRGDVSRVPLVFRTSLSSFFSPIHFWALSNYIAGRGANRPPAAHPAASPFAWPSQPDDLVLNCPSGIPFFPSSRFPFDLYKAPSPTWLLFIFLFLILEK
jgi:hypothetical protein